MTKKFKRALSMMLALLFVVSGCVSFAGQVLPVSAADDGITVTRSGEKIDGSSITVTEPSGESFSVLPDDQGLEASYKGANSTEVTIDDGQNLSDNYLEKLEADETLSVSYTAHAYDKDGASLASKQFTILFKGGNATKFNAVNPDMNNVIVERPSVHRAPAAASELVLESLSAQFFAGAKRQSDGTYLWSVPYDSDQYKAGHAFAFRVNYAVGGQQSDGSAPVDSIHITVPAHFIKDRTGAYADTVDWSIPSKEDVDAATDENGNIDENEISPAVNFAYRLDGDHYTVYNIRPVDAGTHGYFEISYSTAKSSFEYTDGTETDAFSATGTLGTSEKKTNSYRAKIDTGVRLSSVSKRSPYSRQKSWNDSWGTDAKPANADKYYYLVWDIRSDIQATQPYNFTIDDPAVEGNLGKMTVLGIKFSGESTFTKGTKRTIENSRFTGTRYDYVLTAIPLDTYESSNSWTAKNMATVTADPYDKSDETLTKKSTATWSWDKPVFRRPGGHFDSYKRGDGSYRATYPMSLFTGTTHYADSLDIRAGEYTRYDLEDFNGCTVDGQTTAKTKTELNGFDYAVWVVGFPYPWIAANNGNNASDYEDGKRGTVTYTLTDEGVYLLTGTDALTSNRSSENRTIGNGIVNDSKKAIELQNGDYYISSISYTSAMRDAYLDDETQTFQQKNVTYGSNEQLAFEGKFGNSNTWTQFATYNLSTGTASPVGSYVKSMTNNKIVLNDNANLLAYRVTTTNSHYFTEIYTVPSYTVRNSSRVMTLLDGQQQMVLLNNSSETVTHNGATIGTVESSDVDYARVSKKQSKLEKHVVGTGNNTRRQYYTITWKIDEEETITTDTGSQSYIPQNGGIFYDLIPDGSVPVLDSVRVTSGNTQLSSSDYTVKTIPDYKNGRTLLVVRIKDEGNKYSLTYDTRHSWDSLKDYGSSVYNPVAYETGNDSITGGFADNGGNLTQKDLMTNLAEGSGMSEKVTAPKFIYAQQNWDIVALTSASSGLRKQVRADEDNAYTSSTKTHIGGLYSYELRFMNSFTSTAKDIVFYDSIENFDPSAKQISAAASDWKGKLQSIDVSQLEKKGIAPVIYVSTVDGMNPEDHRNLSDSVWTKYTKGMDLSNVKAVAIDAKKTASGEDFTLGAGESIVAYLFMKAPDTAPSAKSGNAYPYAYNNVYVSDTLREEDSGDEADFMLHQDYTRIALLVSGDANVKKISSKTGQPARGITFRLRGTSDYGTEIDRSVKTDRSGMIEFKALEKNIDNGGYILQETDATDDFLLDPTEHRIVIDGQGHTIIDGTDYTQADGTVNPVTIENAPRVHADIEFSKRDSVNTSTPLPGAVFRLSGKSDYGTDVLMTAVSGDGKEGGTLGEVVFANVEKGTYTLKETSGPAVKDDKDRDSYIFDGSEYTVNVDDDGNYTIYKGDTEVSQLKNGSEYYITNEPYHYFTFTKLSTYDNSTVEGAEFTLSGTSDSGNAVNVTAVSEKDTGTVRFDHLEAGTYTLKETKAPANYEKSDKTCIVKMEHDGQYTITGMGDPKDSGYVFYDDRTQDKKITVTKVWDDGKLMDDNPLGTSHSNTTHSLPDLDITITNQVPQASQRTFTVIYDANGGTFGEQ